MNMQAWPFEYAMRGLKLASPVCRDIVVVLCRDGLIHTHEEYPAQL